MANGPLGGFMPTPAAPSQPPSVKVETTADSRGNFSNFLKNMNGAALVDPPVVAPAMGAMTPNIAPASNIDIFNQPQNFLSGGLVQFGRDLQRGLAEPVNQKTREIPQFLQVIEDSAKERFGVDLSGSSSMGGSGSVPFSNISIPGPGLGGFNQFGSDMNIFQPTQQVETQDMKQSDIFQAYMPIDQGEGIDQFGKPMQAGSSTPTDPAKTLELFANTFNQGVLGSGSSPFGSGQARLGGIGSFANMFQPRAYFDGGEVDDFGDPGISFDTSDPSIGDPDISLSSDEIASGTFDDGDSGVTFDDDLAAQPGIVAPGIGAPKEFEPMFPNPGIKIGNFTIPSIFSLANQFSNYSRGRVLDSIVEKGYTPVYGGKNNDVIVGARDPKTGILMEGMDPNEMLGSDDNDTDPIIKNTIKPIVEEEKDDDKPPNVIGGEEPKPIEPTDTSSVVASPFGPATSTIDPVSFDAGELNKLIEMLTGVPAKPVVSKQEGGLVSAVDEFLASAA